jgi:hypothetical protein
MTFANQVLDSRLLDYYEEEEQKCKFNVSRENESLQSLSSLAGLETPPRHPFSSEDVQGNRGKLDVSE